jgi:Tol biopolymer transport system component
MGPDQYLLFCRRKATTSITLTILAALALATGCKSVIDRQDVRPRVLRDVPARNLAYRLEADVTPPVDVKDYTGDKVPGIQTDFNTRRKDDALIRTVVSPDGQRVLALYGTEDAPASAFRIDLYSSEGQFLRNLIPPTISCGFPETVAWSPDGNFISFIAHKKEMPTPTPTPPGYVPLPESSPLPSTSTGPAFPRVAVFDTEQIYICNRDGYDLKPLTAREGLIYFYFQWAPDTHAMVALACKESEWNAREKEYKLPAGRPRLITLDGKERLLDDQVTEALPVWSPDASKVATAFDTDVALYDAANNTPTQGKLPVRDQLISASVIYEQKTTKKTDNARHESVSSSASGVPVSFNPIVRLEWPSPEKLYLQTAYVRLMPNEAINTFQRWHLLHLSAQAAILK